LPSTGIVADCESDTRCRVGAYYGSPDAPTWFAPPSGLDALPRPRVLWHGATFAEARFECGPGCSVSYFFEARRRISHRASVLGIDTRRWLLAAAEGPTVVVRQIFAGRPVARIERAWAPGLSALEAVTDARFDPDGRLTFTWLAGPDRRAVTERVTIPSTALPGSSPSD
jgi:hypothetical protein